MDGSLLWICMRSQGTRKLRNRERIWRTPLMLTKCVVSHLHDPSCGRGWGRQTAPVTCIPSEHCDWGVLSECVGWLRRRVKRVLCLPGHVPRPPGSSPCSLEAGLYQHTMDGPLPVLDGVAKAQLPSSERVGRTQQGRQKDGHKCTLQTKSLGSSALL